jgi:predicted HTH transcriptional regulator
MQELKKVLPMVSEDTVLRDITKMMDKDIIKKQGSTKSAKYLINKG